MKTNQRRFSPHFRRFLALPAPKILLALSLLLCAMTARAQQKFIAYDVPAGVQQDQKGLSSTSVGMDFDVANEIIVTRLGVFDANQDGISPDVTLTARLWDRAQDPPVQLISMDFTADDPGELIGGSRFKTLETPLHLVAGFQGTITGDGWTDTDSINNSFGNVDNVLWTTHDGDGSIVFVGKSRYGSSGEFPGTVDTGPVARFASSTFEFQTTALTLPGKPNVSIAGTDGKITLSWPAVTSPAPAVKYRISRADSPAGPFTELATITDLTYTDSGLANGTAYSYTVQGITAADKVGVASDVKTAAPYVLPTDHYIAYSTPGSLAGNQSLASALGMEFDVQNPIIISRVGVFDANSDGFSSEIDARIYDRDTQQAIATVVFTPDAPGALIEGMRFKDLDQPLRLEAGFHGLIEADGFVGSDPIINSSGNPANVVWTLNDAKGSIQFVGKSRYGSGPPSDYPDTADGGPAARYAAGTFEFQSLPAEFAGIPQVQVVTPYENNAVTLFWGDISLPLPAAKYEVERAEDAAGPWTKLGETTVGNFRDTTAQNGKQYYYRVRAVPASPGKPALSAVVSATPSAPAAGVAYIVPAGLGGNQPLPNYSVGMDFDVVHPVKVTKLGVFDDSSDGIMMPVASVLFDRKTKKAVAKLDFTPENQGELIDGSRFLPLTEPLVLDSGFQGTIVMWFSGGDLEKNYNTGVGIDPNFPALITFGGGSINFVGTSRYGAATDPETYPATADGGPVNRYGAGTFAFEPTQVDHPAIIAYSVPAGTAGTQGVKGAAIGMDFDVQNEIVITRLGVFDDGSDGIKQLMTARLWDINPTNPAPVQVAELEFTSDNPGDLIGGSRFKALPQPLRLPRGFHGSISVDYNDNLEKIKNTDGDPAKVTWTLNGGNGSIAFVGGGRYGGANVFPATADGGPPARYAAGTFEYQTTPPAIPGTPVVSVKPLIENNSVTLSWLPITLPLPAAKYEVLRSDTAGGQFTKIAETTDPTYKDTTAQNGNRYYYKVRALGAGGEIGDNSTVVVGSPSSLLVAYQVPGGLVGNQALNNGAVGMDFDVVSPIKITKFGVFDDSSDGIKMLLTAVVYDRAATQIMAQQEFTPENQGDLIGGSRFITLAQPLNLPAGFQGSMVIWYSDGSDERLWNSFGASPGNLAAHDAAGLQTYGGNLINFVGAGRYGAAGGFPDTVDRGPVDRYAGGTFIFEPGTQVTGPKISFSRTGDKLKLTWDGGGTLERADALGGAWQPVAGATSGVEIQMTGAGGYFRVHQ